MASRKEVLEQLQAVPQGQKDRLAHIDFMLLLKGETNRVDVTDRFNVTAPQVTRDFKLYKDLVPENIEYDKVMRKHWRGKKFKPLFEYDMVRTLSTLSQGFGDGMKGMPRLPMTCEAPYHLNKPTLEVISKVSEAMHRQCALTIEYNSLSSGKSKRDIVPHTLVDNGLRWHVRGFDRKSGEFRDFVLTRVMSAKVNDKAVAQEYELVIEDRPWMHRVNLEIVPHPKIKYSEAIAMDYAMEDGVLNVEVRAATVGYLLRLWNIDCSKDHSLTGSEYHLWLRNSEALYGISNMSIAAGYKAD